MHRARTWTVIGSILLSALAGGCAAPVDESDRYSRVEEELAERNLRRAESVDRIPNYSISGWNYIDSQHVVLHVGVSRQYLVTLMRYCPGLAGSQNLSFTTTGADLTTLDKLIGEEASCHIRRIERLEPVSEERE